MLGYMRHLHQAAAAPAEQKLLFSNQARRTAIGSNLFSDPGMLASTLPGRDSRYFHQFADEPDMEKRKEILSVVSPETARALEAQWVARKAVIEESSGHAVGAIGEGGRLFTREGLEQYQKADTQLNYGNYLRSTEIANFFSRSGFTLPEAGATVWSSSVDDEDLKLRIIQNEGLDSHDFNFFDDRAALLWRKPWINGAVRELTTGDSRSTEDLRLSVEQLMLSSQDHRPRIGAISQASRVSTSEITLDAEVNEMDDILEDVRQNSEDYA